jgi:hypothetical protein
LLLKLPVAGYWFPEELRRMQGQHKEYRIQCRFKGTILPQRGIWWVVTNQKDRMLRSVGKFGAIILL